ncbi:MAG: DUF3226 domain-containing protein [Byssovorax sp.]
MSEFVYIVAEGVQDVAFLGKLLSGIHGAKRVKLLEDLEKDHATWLGTSFKWPLFSGAGTEIDRFSVPAPTFYRLPSNVLVVLRSADSISKIRSTLDTDFESFARRSAKPVTVGIFLDSDDEPVEKRLADLEKALKEVKSVELDMPNGLAELTGGDPRVGVFTAPAPGVDGTLEDLLLLLGEVSFPTLTASAKSFAEEWRAQAIDKKVTGKDWKSIKKPAGGKKAAIGAMTAVLKPGYAAQVSIEQNDWLTDEAKKVERLKPCLDFLAKLLASVTPEAASAPESAS